MTGLTPRDVGRFHALISALYQWWEGLPVEAELTFNPMGEYLEVSLVVLSVVQRKSTVTFLKWRDGQIFISEREEVVTAEVLKKSILNAMLRPDLLPDLERARGQLLKDVLESALEELD